MSNENKYEAGVCNIGPEEKKKRLKDGYSTAVITVLLLIVLVLADVPRGFRLLTAIPAMLSAAGYIQYSMNFCTYFGLASVFNFGTLRSQTNVKDKNFLLLD